MSGRHTIDEILDRARRRIMRYSPQDAWDAVTNGAVLIDTRSDIDVRTEGRIPHSVYHHRNVLEWRCDPASSHADPRIADLDKCVIIMCNDGYSSILAAASLADLGFRRPGDLIGGFRAWKAAGLPVDYLD
jgi:rhodanese-related sulfurtransferase